jgi:hypothetical protein
MNHDGHVLKGAQGFLALALLLCFCVFSRQANAQTWTISVILHEATSISDDDASGPDDLYWKASIVPTVGTGAAAFCNFKPSHVDDVNHITPNWTCTAASVTGGPTTTVQINLQLWDHDSTSADDHFDINPDAGAKDISISFSPANFQMSMNVPGWQTPRCAIGPIRMRGWHGDDFGEVVFSVSASIVGAPNGDSDGDGLPDSAEFCGMDTNGDGVVDVDLPGMGAKVNRKDVFVEIDWMVNATGLAATQHSHEPWLPALITSWNEFNAAPVTNPPMPGLPARPGIAMHLDVGTLYAGYAMDFDGNGTVDFSVPPDGNLDLDGDGIPDIGNLGALGTGTAGGGNALADTPAMTAAPPAGTDFFNAGSTFFGIKAANFNPVRNLVFHYNIFGHQWGAPAGTSSGLAEPCGIPACNDFMVTLGTWPRENIDANRDGVPDPVGPLLRSPSGLPVDGTVNQHVGTFLHELGHNLSLGHGGGDGVNFKPNYLSIMNYSWQVNGLGFDFNGDLLGDPVGLDFDRNGLVDLRRFMYSNAGLNPLNEFALNENVGIADGNTLTVFSCPPPPGPGGNRIGPGTGNINWNCNANPTEPGVAADINGGGLSPGLAGFNDYNQVANAGLLFQAAAPGITLEEYQQLQSTTSRISRLPNREYLQNRCMKRTNINFDDLKRDTKVTNQYAPLASFVQDGLRTPLIIDRSGRGGAPTASPENSLLNRQERSEPASLVVAFDPPQRAVAISLGRIATELQARAVLQAFDTSNLNMGQVTVPLPPASTGVSTPIDAVAIFPDQLIGRIEVRYETPFNWAATTTWAPLVEPQAVDNLIVCDRLDSSDIKPQFPPPPKFGDLPVSLRVNAVVLAPSGSGDSEPGHTKLVEVPVTGVPVTVDGTSAATDLTVTRKEGQTVQLAAPAAIGAGTNFVHWRLDKTIQFGDALKDLSLTLLRPGTLTAVYERESEHSHPPGREPTCQCIEKCCSQQEEHRDRRRGPH